MFLIIISRPLICIESLKPRQQLIKRIVGWPPKNELNRNLVLSKQELRKSYVERISLADQCGFGPWIDNISKLFSSTKNKNLKNGKTGDFCFFVCCIHQHVCSTTSWVTAFNFKLKKANKSFSAPSFKTCPRNSPNVAECIKGAMEHLKPLLKSGKLAPGFVVDSKSLLSIKSLQANSIKHFPFQASILLPSAPSTSIGALNWSRQEWRSSVFLILKWRKFASTLLISSRLVNNSGFWSSQNESWLDLLFRKLEMILAIPKITTKSAFTMNWKLALFNLQGKGDAHSQLGE